MVLRRTANNTHMKTRPLHRLAMRLTLTMLAFTAMAKSNTHNIRLAMLLVSKNGWTHANVNGSGSLRVLDLDLGFSLRTSALALEMMQYDLRSIEIASIAWWTFSSPQLPAYSFVHLSTSEPARKVFLCNIYRKKTTSGELNYILKRNDPLKTLYNWLSYALHYNSKQECNTDMLLNEQTVMQCQYCQKLATCISKKM